MSAFQQAVLSVAPERLEQFTREMKKNISEKPSKRKGESSADKSSSGQSKSRNYKHSSRVGDVKKSRTSVRTNIEKKRKRKEKEGRNSSLRSRSKDQKGKRKSSLSEKKSVKDKHKDSKEESDFDPKDLDLSTPLPPLGDLVKDRNALLDTAFSVIKGPKLTSMLPDILKLTPLEEIKRLCKEQLNVMSSKRILHAIAGTEMESSSGTESSDDERGTRKVHTKEQKKPLVSNDHSLQTNFVDSTTSDHPPASMLFPSAIGTALTSAVSTENIPAREIANENNDEDDVSTSTEPNFIYPEDVDNESAATSGTEDGEVQTSDYASSSGEAEDKVQPTAEEIETRSGESVFVEVEEIEEEHEEDCISGNSRQNAVGQKPQIVQPKKLTVEKLHTSKDGKMSGDASETSNAAKKVDASDSAASVSGDAYAGKSQLEILELELRARAIKSLMKATQAGKLKP